MAKKALLKKEDIAAVPPDQEVLIETADPPEPVEKTEPPVEVITAEPKQEENELVKRLADLEKSEKTLRERAERAEAEAAASRQQATQVAQERDQFRDSSEQAQLDAILNAITASQAEIESAKRDVVAARAAQDLQAELDAQERLSKAASTLGRLEDGKQAFEARKESVKKEPPKQDDPFEAQISQLPDTAKNWLRNHRDYITDRRKNAKIQALHWDVMDEGHQQFSPSYFESLEVHLGLKEKPKTETEEPEQRREAVVSAPVSRDAQSISTGKPVSTKVTLTPEEREIAKMTGVDERVYAQNKLKLQDLKRNGYYRES